MLPSIPGLTTGELEKLIITAFTDAGRSTLYQDPFVVMFNPTTYKQHFEVVYCNRKAVGSQGSPQVFNHIKPQVFDLEFLFDGTQVAGPPVADLGVAISLPGASSLPGVGSLLDRPQVHELVEKFKNLTYQMVDNEHRTTYLTLCWGTLVVDCIMQSADVDYTLFKPNGHPLRAKVRATFKEDCEESLRVRKEGKTSPDLTHLRQVEEEENLPLMSQAIYKDPTYYVQLARSNKLKHFRRLRTGQKLSFPPIRTQNGNS